MGKYRFKQIQELVATGKVTSLTVDVFDTVLLYDYWPSDLRFLDLATRWLPQVQQMISPLITSFELYSCHLDSKRQLDQNKLSSRIDIWLDITIDTLLTRYNITLDEEGRFNLLTSMMAIEIESIIEITKPNTTLLSSLNKLKETFPKLKIYFIADSDLMAEQIKTILQLQRVETFDGGVSSADYNKTKASGELFEQLAAEFAPHFDLTKNLHLGDERDEDFLVPRQHDSLAIHYRPIRLRGLRTLVGTTWLKLLRFSTQRTAAHKLHQLTNNTDLIWQKYGTTLSEIERAWLMQIQSYIRVYDHTEMIFAGPEITNLAQTSAKLTNNDRLHFAPELTRENLLRAFLWLLAAFDTAQWDRARLLQLLMQRENLSRQNLYQLCFTENYQPSLLAINSFREEEFAQHFLNELLAADKTNSAPAREAYIQVANYLPRNSKTLTWLQICDDGAMQLFQNFTELHGVTNAIQPFFLDQAQICDAAMAVLGTLNGRQEKVIALRLPEIEAPHLELAPETYLQTVLIPELRRLTKQILPKYQF